MALTTFTIEDRRRLQHYLNLPIQEVRENSALYQALLFVEQLEQQEPGLDIAISIQSRLDLLEALESLDGSSGTLTVAIQDAGSQIKSERIEKDYQVEYFPDGGIRVASGGKIYGEAASLALYKEKLIKDIKRDIGFSQQMADNTLRTAYPSGIASDRRFGMALGEWRY